MPLELESLEKAVTTLKAVLEKSQDAAFMDSLDAVARNAIRAGVIQHFEIVYELSWKFLKRWLETQVSATAVDGVTRRELFRQAAEQRLIVDVEQWMRYHFARNLTSHTYEPAIADQVVAITEPFAHDAMTLLDTLKARNDD